MRSTRQDGRGDHDTPVCLSCPGFRQGVVVVVVVVSSDTFNHGVYVDMPWAMQHQSLILIYWASACALTPTPAGPTPGMTPGIGASGTQRPVVVVFCCCPFFFGVVEWCCIILKEQLLLERLTSAKMCFLPSFLGKVLHFILLSTTFS